LIPLKASNYIGLYGVEKKSEEELIKEIVLGEGHRCAEVMLVGQNPG